MKYIRFNRIQNCVCVCIYLFKKFYSITKVCSRLFAYFWIQQTSFVWLDICMRIIIFSWRTFCLSFLCFRRHRPFIWKTQKRTESQISKPIYVKQFLHKAYCQFGFCVVKMLEFFLHLAWDMPENNDEERDRDAVKMPKEINNSMNIMSAVSEKNVRRIFCKMDGVDRGLYSVWMCFCFSEDIIHKIECSGDEFFLNGLHISPTHTVWQAPFTKYNKRTRNRNHKQNSIHEKWLSECKAFSPPNAYVFANGLKQTCNLSPKGFSTHLWNTYGFTLVLNELGEQRKKKLTSEESICIRQ